MTTLIESMDRLLEDAKLYTSILDFSDTPIRVGFELTDTRESVTLLMADGLTYQEGLHDPAVTMTTTSEILTKVMRGEADFFALGSRGHINDKKPVDFQFLDRGRLKESMEALYRLGIYFFVPGGVKARRMNLELAGSAHGARPIPLVYWDDLRSAWYHIPQGSTLNEEGEQDPYPQAFIVLKGRGRLEIENVEVEIEPQTTYYIPCDSIHKIHADTDVELIWLAWKAPMFG